MTTTGSAADAAGLLKAINEGLGINGDNIVFCITPGVFPSTNPSCTNVKNPAEDGRGEGADMGVSVLADEGEGPFVKVGDVVMVRPRCVDLAMWECGGAAVGLRLVQLAKVRCSRLCFIASSRE